MSAKLSLHKNDQVRHLKVKSKANANHQKVGDDGECHLVELPLLDALLPDVELQRDLSLAAKLAQRKNVAKESIVDALQVGTLHNKEGGEGLTKRQDGAVNRVLTLVYQIKDLYNHRVFE